MSCSHICHQRLRKKCVPTFVLFCNVHTKDFMFVRKIMFSLPFILFLFLALLIEHARFRLICSVLKCISPFRHTAALATYLRKMLLALRHENGASVCKVYKSDSLKVSFVLPFLFYYYYFFVFVSKENGEKVSLLLKLIANFIQRRCLILHLLIYYNQECFTISVLMIL